MVGPSPKVPIFGQLSGRRRGGSKKNTDGDETGGIKRGRIQGDVDLWSITVLRPGRCPVLPLRPGLPLPRQHVQAPSDIDESPKAFGPIGVAVRGPERGADGAANPLYLDRAGGVW